MESRGTPIDAGGREPPPASDLPPRTAAMLAYLAGPFSGALILFAGPGDADVRFHAWQSILALGGLAALLALSYLLAFAALFVSAAAVSVMIAVGDVLWVVLAIVWAVCLSKAYAGGRWKLPLAGDYAERRA